MNLLSLSFELVLLAFALIASVAVFVLVLQILLWRRLGRLQSTDAQLTTFVTQLTTVQATVEMVDQRLARLHSQLADDNALYTRRALRMTWRDGGRRGRRC